MSSAPIMPFVFPRQWSLDGLPLSGGRLYFYESGTTTPKVTFQEPTKTVINQNPVILDASGFAPIYLDSGYYTVILKDVNDVQLFQPLDGIAGVVNGFGDSSDIRIVAVENYNALRNLQAEYDLVYVGGRSFNADGGEGWFFHDPNYQLSDDDGYILTSNAGATKYIRLNQDVIDPRYYGVVYSSVVSQYTQFLHALDRSAVLGLNVVVNGNVYINQNITVPTKATLQFTENGYLSSTAGINITFTSRSNLIAFSEVFGQAVSPKFQSDVVADNIKLSWMAATTDDERLTKLFNSSSISEQVLEIDQSLNIAPASLSTSASVLFTNNSIITTTSAGTLSLSFRILNVADKIFNIPGTVTIGSFNFGKHEAFPEWFGAIGDGSADDSFPFWYSTLGGYTYVTSGKQYFLNGGTTTPSYPANYRITGEGTIKIGGSKTLGNGNLWLYNATILLDSPHIWFNGSYLEAINSSIPSSFTATTRLIDGCVYTDDAVNRFPVSDGKPGIYNAHLPLIISAGCLATDGQGKIYDCSVRPSLIPGSTYSYVVNDIAWSSGLYGVSLKIAPISDKIAHIAAHVIFNPTGNITPWPSQDFAYIEFDSADSQIKSWLIAPFYSGHIDKCFREDYVTVYDTAVPSIIAKEGRRFVFGDTKGLGGNPHSGTMVTPNPYMGWGNIWPRMSYSTAFVTHEIAWSGLLIKP